jgi:hypothetical protein
VLPLAPLHKRCGLGGRGHVLGNCGLENYEDIPSVTDGIMVAREDLAMDERG